MWSSVLNIVLAWAKSSRWRRASRCKRLIEQLQLHLAAQKHRRESIIRQSRADIAQLLQNDRLQQALTRVQQLYKDQCLLAAYDQINQLCECIITSMPHIGQQQAWQCLPIDVSQAISNLIFASSRCGDLPELHVLRSLFKIRYGSKFETTNVELLPGNLVDSKMKENLSVNSVPEDVKLWLINGISYEYNIHLGFQDFGHSFRPQWQEKAEVLDLDIQDICSDSDESSLDSSIDDWKAQSGSSSSSSHVHPKLPNYEDVVAKFTDIKAEYRHRKSFYY